MIPWKKLNSSLRSVILRYFYREYQFTFPKSLIRLSEKREEKEGEEEEEQRQLESVMHFKQTQIASNSHTTVCNTEILCSK